MSSARGNYNQNQRSHHFQKKNAREQRLQFMNSQAALIAQKKKEIEEKLALQQSSASSPSEPIKVEEIAAPSPTQTCEKAPLPFKNDGSFLEQFLKQQRATQMTASTSVCNQSPYLTPPPPPPQLNFPPPSSYSFQQPSPEHSSESAQTTFKEEIKREERSPSPYSPSRPCEDDDEQPTFSVDSKDHVQPNTIQPGTSYSSPTHANADSQERISYSNSLDLKRKFKEEPDRHDQEASNDEAQLAKERERKRQSRWGPQQPVIKEENPTQSATSSVSSPSPSSSSSFNNPSPAQPPPSILARSAVLSRITTADPQILTYAVRVFGTTDLTEEQWKQCMDQVKMQYIYCEMLRKKQERDRLESAGRMKYEYDSDEETEGGTWEHKRRLAEMEKTKEWADQLTHHGRGKHHLGDFLPPEELNKFMQKFQAVQEGRALDDESDYQEFKIAETNVGYQMLKKFGWTEGQGLGLDGSGITAPVNATRRNESQGLGAAKPDDLTTNDNEYDAYRKRMMLAYRFRPNPLNNPRRPYY